jgi:two-component system, cell cycle response regulator
MPNEAQSEPPRVLVADDDRAARDLVAELLERNGMQVEKSASGRDAVERALSNEFDIVLLDVVMPDLGGLECCRMIKARSTAAFLPVVMITVRNQPDQRVEGLRVGADDYVGKPYDERELVARVGALLRLKRMYDSLARAREHLEDMATQDEMTGLRNYRYLKDRLSEEFRRSTRYGNSVGCVLLDIDNFKEVNDTHGHLAGDRVLQLLAERVLTTVREVDVVARYGGDEFLLLMPETDGAGALVAAERIRRAVNEKPFEIDGAVEFPVTISAGTSHFPSNFVANPDDLIRTADRSLYEAKSAGRNRVRTPNDV